MNEMRHDWLSDRWVIFAPNRTMRPDDYDRTPHIEPESHLRCPFCRGAENETPEASLVLPGIDWESTRSFRKRERQAELSEWLVRVVPNKFPAVTLPAALPDPLGSWSPTPLESIREPCPTEFGDDRHSGIPSLFRKQTTAGAHEVIIESPDHIESMTCLSQDHVRLVFEAYRQRLAYWRARTEMKYAVVFKNYGADAGATIVHSHSQLICTNFVPSDVLRRQKRLAAYYDTHRRCYDCSILEQELIEGERVVAESKHFVAVCPFASRFPYSVSILPRNHCPHYAECSSEELEDLAQFAPMILLAIEQEHPRCAYNVVLQTSPFDLGNPEAFHWRLKIIPRLSKIAGFEWSSDCFINTVLPEVAAQTLRQRIQGVNDIYPQDSPASAISLGRVQAAQYMGKSEA